MTETIDSLNPSYEALEQDAPGKGGEKLRALNKARAEYSEFVRELKDDPKYSPEYKSEAAWARYEEVSAFVEETAAEAIKDFERSIAVNERFSIPMPADEHLVTKEVDKALLTQGEEARIYRKIEYVPETIRRMRDQGKNTPKTPSRTDVLGEEFARGFELGGPLGGAICRAVYQIARDTGEDINDIVDAHRRDYHRKALADMERAMRSRELVGRGVRKPDFPNPARGDSGRGGDFHTGRGTSRLINDRGAPQPVRSSGHVGIRGRRKNRKPSWK